MTEPELAPEPAAEATPASMPGETLARETTLLANFEQMEIRPFRRRRRERRSSSRPDRACESAAEQGFAPLPHPNRRRYPTRCKPRRRTQPCRNSPRSPLRDATRTPARRAPAPAAMAEVAPAPDVAAARSSRGPGALRSTGRIQTVGRPISTRPIFCLVPSRSPTRAFCRFRAAATTNAKAVLPQPEFVSTPTEPAKAEGT